MNKFKPVFLLIGMTFLLPQLKAAVITTSTTGTLNDSLLHTSKNAMKHPMFQNYNLFLLGGLSLSKQNISLGNYSSNFNYDLSEYNKDVFKPGYYAGFRLDGNNKGAHNFSFEVVLSKIVSGTKYNESGNLSPFIGNFSNFKADDQFFTLTTAAHYRKLLVFGDTLKRKFYIMAGPSMETRLSQSSNDNLVHNNYQRFNLRGDIGVEYESQSNFTLFIHYKQGLTSFTKAPINTTLNSLNIGILVRASDLF